jgi:retron-type reverse transcriptase
MERVRFAHTYEEIISVENLLDAWQEFVKGKRNRADALVFERQLMANIFSLHERLAERTYRHSGYEAFSVSDPKPRNIHKASVSDRVLHRAIYRKLYPSFDRLFIADSFSCRVRKGTHKALDRFRTMAGKVSRNHTRTCWVLKCDIRKFFASIDHGVLLSILAARICDKDVLWLLSEVIGSFSSGMPGVGLPLGNLTSQLFANVVMDPFDQFAKHRLKVRHYVRYADDFVFLSDERDRLIELLPQVSDFLSGTLRLTLHPDKIFLRTFASGVDFLGWVHFPDHRVLRTATKRRMMRRLAEHPTDETLQSYLGLLKHGNAVGCLTPKGQTCAFVLRGDDMPCGVHQRRCRVLRRMDPLL